MIHLTKTLIKRWLEKLLHVHDTPQRTAAAFALGVFCGLTISVVYYGVLLNVGAIFMGLFAGYATLDPLRIADFATPPVAADLLLGAAVVRRSQLIKQPDVLMLHHLVPEEVAADSLARNLDHYGPRTAHGSSLSPAIHASLCARAPHCS